MSESVEDGQLNGHAIAEDDLRDLLEREKQQVKRLRTELEQERTHRTRAESAATSAASRQIESEEQAADARLAAAEEEAKRLRREYSDALAEGRFEDAAEANDKTLALRAAQQQDRQYKAWLAAERQRAQQPPPSRQAPDQTLDLSGYTAGQRRWIQDNPDFMTDEKVRLKTIAGHNLAVANGVPVDSDDYFEIINRTVYGKQRRQEEGEDEDEGRDDGHEGTPYRAPEMPVTRRAQTQPGRNISYRLTPAEREAADTSLPDVPIAGYTDQNGRKVLGRYERYALRRAQLREQGRG